MKLLDGHPGMIQQKSGNTLLCIIIFAGKNTSLVRITQNGNYKDEVRYTPNDQIYFENEDRR